MHYDKQYTVIIAKVRELCRKYLNRNRLIRPIIKLYCLHYYHIVICHIMREINSLHFGV